MRALMIGVTAAAITIAAIGPVRAQFTVPGPQVAYGPQQQVPPAPAYAAPYRYPFPGVAPRDAYRVGLINRFELEQVEGPQPQALQGPSVDGYRGFQ